MTHYRLMFCAALLLALSSAPLYARQYQEVAPTNPAGSYVVSPRLFGTGNRFGGTYYAPQVVTTSDTVWLFVMGGQFDGGPAEPCSGDKVLVFKLPLTLSGITSPINSNTVKQRVSPCDNVGDTTKLYHYSTGDIVFDDTHKTYRMISERWEARSNTIKVRLFEGWYRNTGAGWNVNWYDFLNVAAGGPPRVTAFLLEPDTFRANRVFGNSYFRGYMKMGLAGMAEVRAEFPPLASCPTPGLRCASIEFKRGGVWTQAANQTLSFIPDALPQDFRISKLTTMNGRLELWGSVLGPSTTNPACGRCWNATEAQQSSAYAYSIVTLGPEWSLGTLNTITSTVRCMPAWHRSLRLGLAFIRLPSNGKLYMFSSSNDDDICDTLDHPFHGMDIVWTQLQ